MDSIGVHIIILNNDDFYIQLCYKFNFGVWTVICTSNTGVYMKVVVVSYEDVDLNRVYTYG